MENVSDLLKSKSFIKQQLYDLFVSKFQKKVIPTDKKQFLDCFYYDEKTCALKFFYKFGNYDFEHIEVLFGTGKAVLGIGTRLYLYNEEDDWIFTYDYLKLVIQQLESVDRIKSLTTSAEAFSVSQILASKIVDGGSQVVNIKRKCEELKITAKERVALLECLV